MSDNHNDHQHMNIPKYIGVFLILFIGTIVTYFVALTDLDGRSGGAFYCFRQNDVDYPFFHARLLES